MIAVESHKNAGDGCGSVRVVSGDRAELMIQVKRRVCRAFNCFRTCDKELYGRLSTSLKIKARVVKAQALEKTLYGCVMLSPNADRYSTTAAALHQLSPKEGPMPRAVV